MPVFNLPYDIFPGQQLPAAEIIMHDYTAHIGAFKGKSILHTNAISLVIKGQKKMHFAEKSVAANEDSFHFLSAGNCLVSMELSEKDVFRSVLIFFTDEVLTDFYVKHDKLVQQYKAGKQVGHEPYISLQKDDFIHHYIASLLLIFKSGKAVSSQMKQLKFEELMLYLLEKYPLTLLSFQRNNKNNFNDLQIRKTVEDNITGNLTVEELAFLCNLSLSTFKRRFAGIYHTSPVKWLLQRRMEIAANLLKHHKEKPGEVFHKLGYENHSSFSKSFKQVYGVSPRAWQSQNLNV